MPFGLATGDKAVDYALPVATRPIAGGVPRVDVFDPDEGAKWLEELGAARIRGEQVSKQRRAAAMGAAHHDAAFRVQAASPGYGRDELVKDVGLK
ncbi:hypothetical protein GCM10011395_33980 [Sphingomonas psychrolutea]|uniref:Uncharacterized protein n=1 Tax=Sphingomonas psychrolutea TaxID=1259676 RepID=A0ABQ1H7V4_9SPHN|nr:hypothetical protein GCM10011395_33980 [Sphingomonas psychrolutea]